MGPRYAKRLLLIIGLCLLMLLSFTFAVSAQGEVEADIELWLNDQGDIKACLGKFLCLDTDGVNALLKAYQVNMEIPDFTQLYKMVSSYGVESVSLAKNGTQIDVGVNGAVLMQITLGEADLDRALKEFVKEGSDMLMPWLQQGELVVLAHFGSSTARGQVPIAAMSAPSTPVNFIEVKASVSPKGKITSVAGIDPGGFGIALPELGAGVMDLLGKLGIKAASLVVEGNRLTVTASETKVVIDVPQALVLADPLLPDEAYIDTAASWVKDSSIAVMVEVSDKPFLTAPRFELGRPINVAISDAGKVSVEGFDLGFSLSLPPMVKTLLGDGVALTVDGPSSAIKAASGFGELAVIYDPKSLISVGSTLMTDPNIHWEWIKELASSAVLNAELRLNGSTAALPATGFDLGKAPTVGSILPVSIGSDGSVGLWGQLIPLNKFGVSLDLKPYMSMLEMVDSVSVGATGVMAEVEGSTVEVRLIGETRKKLMDFAAKEFALPPIVVGTVNNFLNLTGTKMLQMPIEKVDGTVPTGFIATVVGWFMPN